MIEIKEKTWKFLTLDDCFDGGSSSSNLSVFLAYDTNDNKRFVAIFSNGLLGKCCAQMSTRHFLMNLGCQRIFIFG